MNLFKKLRQILSIKVPYWLGISCYILLVITVLLLIFVILFPEWMGNFIAEHDIRL